MYPVEDPQAVRNPRPDTTYFEIGNDGSGGSRMIYWAWNPVGYSNLGYIKATNTLLGKTFINSVSIAGN